MKIRFKLIWNKATHPDPLVLELRGLARVVDDETVDGHVKTLWLDARALCKLGAVTAYVLWLGTLGGLYYWLQRDNHNRIGLADLAFPWRWSKISDLRGQGYIAGGLDSLRVGRIGAGLFEVRQGLARHPDDYAARLEVAQTYARFGYYVGIRDIMLPQLALTPPPREFLRFLLETAAQNDDHATMLAVCDRALGAGKLAADDRGWLLEQKAAALIAQGKTSSALAVLDAAGRGRSLERRRLQVIALLGAGRFADAVAVVRVWPADGVPAEFRLQLLAAAYEAAGQPEQMAEAIKELERQYPTAPEPWIEAIKHYARVGWRDAAWNELQDCLRRFDADASVVARVQWACTEIGAPDLAALCVENTRELGRPHAVALAELVTAQLVAGDLAAAERTFERLLVEEREARNRLAPVVAEDGVGFKAESARFDGSVVGTVAAATNGTPGLRPQMRDWLRTLIEAAALPESNRADVHCSVLQRGGFLLSAFTRSAEVLAKARHWPAVAAVARAGLAQFPGSTQLTRWSEKAAEKIAALPAPQPAAAAVSVTAAATPSGPNYAEMPMADFFGKLDDAMRRSAWAEAGGLLHGVNTAAPPWRRRVEADLAWHEVRIAFEQDDRPQLLYLIGQRIRTRKAEVSRALEFARWYREKGEPGAARLIVGRILQEVPGYVAGQDFMAELVKAAEPKPPPAAPAPK